MEATRKWRKGVRTYVAFEQPVHSEMSIAKAVMVSYLGPSVGPSASHLLALRQATCCRHSTSSALLRAPYFCQQRCILAIVLSLSCIAGLPAGAETA